MPCPDRVFIAEDKQEAPTSGKRFSVYLVYPNTPDEHFRSKIRSVYHGLEGNDFEIHGPIPLNIKGKTGERALEAAIEQTLNGLMHRLLVHEERTRPTDPVSVLV